MLILFCPLGDGPSRPQQQLCRRSLTPVFIPLLNCKVVVTRVWGRGPGTQMEKPSPRNQYCNQLSACMYATLSVRAGHQSSTSVSTALPLDRGFWTLISIARQPLRAFGTIASKEKTKTGQNSASETLTSHRHWRGKSQQNPTLRLRRNPTFLPVCHRTG